MEFWNTDIVRTKKCSKCGEIKNLETEFSKNKKFKDGYQYICKECAKKRSKQWRQDNKEHVKEYKAQWKQNNPEYHAQWNVDNKEHVKEYNAQYYQNNKEYAKEYSAQYYQNNREHLNQYQNEKYHSDPLYRMRRNIGNRTNQAFKAKSWHKNGGTEELLGCDWKTAFNHIQSKFKDGMSWDNKGEWHIDHIVPLDCARDEEEMKKLCHYTNLQPLWATPNMSKSNKVLKEHYDLHYKLLGRHYE